MPLWEQIQAEDQLNTQHHLLSFNHCVLAALYPKHSGETAVSAEKLLRGHLLLHLQEDTAWLLPYVTILMDIVIEKKPNVIKNAIPLVHYFSQY